MLCWTCILKQRIKLNDKRCPMCKEESDRFLISANPNDKINDWQGGWIQDPNMGIVYASMEIKAEVERKIGFHCLKCEDRSISEGHGMVRKFPTLQKLREHMVNVHKIDYCELCLDAKPVLQFEQVLYRYEAL